MTSTLAQVIAIVVLAPLLQGAMKRLRARLAGRPGPGILQSYRDLAKLWNKEALLPDGVSKLTIVAPGLLLGIACTFAALVPVAPRAPSTLDAVALVLLLALGRFVLGLAALDTRSAFAGMAASREMTFATLAEPTLLIALLAGPGPVTFAAFFLVLLLETARVPIDNQETHYELTMMHEGLVLEYSGWQVALVQSAAYIRQLAFFLLAASLLLGHTSLAMQIVLVAAIAVTITLVETLFAKVRLFEVPQILTTAFVLAAVGFGLRLSGALG